MPRRRNRWARSIGLSIAVAALATALGARARADRSHEPASTIASKANGDPGRGRPLYDRRCRICHGRNGDGTGPSASSLRVRPKDLRKVELNEAYWFRIIKFGSRAVGKSAVMDGYGRVLTDAQIRDVIAYVRTLRGGSAGSGAAPGPAGSR